MATENSDRDPRETSDTDQTTWTTDESPDEIRTQIQQLADTGSVHARAAAIEIRPPESPSDEELRLLRAGLIKGIEKIYNSTVDINSIEFLAFPDASGAQVYVLALTTEKVRRMGNQYLGSEQGTLSETITDKDDPDEGSLDYVVEMALRKLRQTLSGSVELTPVQLSFAPLGHSNATTCQFLNQKNHRLTKSEHIVRGANRFHALLGELLDEPYIYQVILNQRDDGKYNVCSRVALFHPQHQAMTDGDASRFVDEGFDTQPSRAVSELNLSSNFKVLSDHLYASSEHRHKPRVGGYLDLPVTAKRNMPELFLGYPDYRNLLGGRRSYSPTYEKLNYYSTFVVPERGLTQLMGLLPVTHDDPWASTPGREPPKRTPFPADITAAPGSPAETAARSQALAATSEPTSEKDGSTMHYGSVSMVAERLNENGWLVHIVNQAENGSVPDIWALKPTGELVAVEVETTNASAPAALLTNVERAVHWGVEIMIVWTPRIDSSSSISAKKNAEKGIQIIKNPFNDSKRDYSDPTLLYNQKEQPVQCPDGTTPLLPTTVSQSRWWLLPDGTLQLRANGAIIAEGPATDSVDTFDYETPAYHREDGTYIIEDVDGAVIDRCEELPSTWTKVRTPFVPSRLTYLPYPTFKYLENDRLETFDPQGDWDTPEHMPRYRGALTEYFETYTVAHSDEQLLRDPVRAHCGRWYRQLTDHKEPTKNIFEQAIPDFIEKSAVSRETGKDRHYDNRTWRYPRDLRSPDLPEFGDHPEYPDEWESKITHDLPREEHEIIDSTGPLADDTDAEADSSASDDQNGVDEAETTDVESGTDEVETTTEETDTTTDESDADESDADEDGTDEAATTAEDEPTANETADTTETDTTAESTDDD